MACVCAGILIKGNITVVQTTIRIELDLCVCNHKLEASIQEFVLNVCFFNLGWGLSVSAS